MNSEKNYLNPQGKFVNPKHKTSAQVLNAVDLIGRLITLEWLIQGLRNRRLPSEKSGLAVPQVRRRRQ